MKKIEFDDNNVSTKLRILRGVALGESELILPKGDKVIKIPLWLIHRNLECCSWSWIDEWLKNVTQEEVELEKLMLNMEKL